MKNQPADAEYDLLIRAGRVYSGSLPNRLAAADAPLGSRMSGAVAVRGGKIVAMGHELSGTARQVLDFPNGVLLPGLVDLHAHPAHSGSVFGLEPDRYFLARGTTTVLSQGDAGADRLDEYVRETMEGSVTRVRLAINLSRIGESTPGGCFERLEWADVDACVAAVARHRPSIWGIAVNASHHACGPTDPRRILQRALQAAAQTNLPLLYGLRRAEDWPLAQQFERLRPGDVVTYCFRRRPHCIVERGRVLAEVREARARGILFDVGHGTGSFDFVVAEAAIRDGFAPDTISTDLQARHRGQTPQHDLPLVMSKLMAAGMPQDEVFAASTHRPADVLRSGEQFGRLAVGLDADLVVVQAETGTADMTDTSGNQRRGVLLRAVLTLRAGRVIV